MTKHIHNTVTRIRRIIKDTRWRTLADVRPQPFLEWRGTLQCSAKTKKEYQISFCAFLNWLVETDQLLANPLARVGTVETRGKQVRPSRSFTEDELQRLLGVAGKRKLAYQVLLYTGQRKSEVRSLVWGDLNLEGNRPFVLFREGTMKDKAKRAVPLRPEIAAALLAIRSEDFNPSKKVFWFCWPTYDILRSDLMSVATQNRPVLATSKPATREGLRLKRR